MHKFFIVVDGPDGSGKTTALKRLIEHLEKKEVPTYLTKEPGADNEVCLDIERILKKSKGEMDELCETFLFHADRAQHVSKMLIPFLEKDSPYKLLICDRYIGSSYAYQRYSRGAITLEEFRFLTAMATRNLMPDLTLWFDISVETSRARNTDKEDKKDRFERENSVFHQNVREGYIHFFTEIYTFPYVRIDAGKDPEEVFNLVLHEVEKLLDRDKKILF